MALSKNTAEQLVAKRIAALTAEYAGTLPKEAVRALIVRLCSVEQRLRVARDTLVENKIPIPHSDKIEAGPVVDSAAIGIAS